MGLVLEWIQRQGGVAALEATNIAKVQLLYEAIDQSKLYENRVHPSCRSRMNVPFYLSQESLNTAFLAGAHDRGLLQLKGHKSVGGMRASLYNAMPMQGVQALVAYMREFEHSHA
jgi:phosphoserine aminotransferase